MAVSDVSGITTAGYTPPPNPLATMGQYATIANALASNKLLQAQTGQVGVNTDIAKQNLLEKKTGYIAGRLSTMAYLPRDQQTKANYNTELDRELSLGADPDQVSSFRTMINAANSPDELASIAFRTGQSLAPPDTAQKMVMPSWIDIGGQKVPVQPPGLPGANQPIPGKSIDTTVSPEVLARPFEYTDSNQYQEDGTTLNPNYGKKVTTTVGDFLKANGGIPTTPQTTAPATRPTTGSPPPIQKLGGVQTGPSTAQIASDQQAVTTTKGWQDAAQPVTQNKADYANLLSDLQAITTGPGTSDENKTAAFIAKWAGKGYLPKDFDAKTLAKSETFAKISQTIANRQAGVLSGSDQSQNSAIASTPNPNISTDGNIQILHKLQGNEDAIAAKNDAWKEWSAKNGVSAASVNGFTNWWNKNIDIRAFQSQYMPKGGDERKALIDGLPAAQEKEFYRRNKLLLDAQKNGWGSVLQ